MKYSPKDSTVLLTNLNSVNHNAIVHSKANYFKTICCSLVNTVQIRVNVASFSLGCQNVKENYLWIYKVQIAM